MPEHLFHYDKVTACLCDITVMWNPMDRFCECPMDQGSYPLWYWFVLLPINHNDGWNNVCMWVHFNQCYKLLYLNVALPRSVDPKYWYWMTMGYESYILLENNLPYYNENNSDGRNKECSWTTSNMSTIYWPYARKVEMTL